MQKNDIISLRDIQMTYEGGVKALKSISFSIFRGEAVAIMGKSGSGKSTLLNILGCLDYPTHGSYFFNGKDVSLLSDDELSDFRNRNIGFIFQSFNLIPQLSVIENIEVPLFYRRTEKKKGGRFLLDLLKKWDLSIELIIHLKSFQEGNVKGLL